MENKMFCYQCQETAGCTGCTQVGVCGKKPEVAAMQDLLVSVTKGLSAVTTKLRAEGKPVSQHVNHLITLNLFATITNANFDYDALVARVRETLAEKVLLLAQLDVLVAVFRSNSNKAIEAQGAFCLFGGAGCQHKQGGCCKNDFFHIRLFYRSASN